MIKCFKKFFFWIKDHFSLLIQVVFRLGIEEKKENPDEMGSNPSDVDDESEKLEKGNRL